MNQYKLIMDYKDNSVYRKGFVDLARRTFGIDFEPWYENGYWNERYVCYSYADGDKVISNVSVNDMDLTINGEEKKAIQIATVMTDPDYRNQGLAAGLMENVLEKYEKDYDLIYLSANESVLEFYPKFGFNLVDETSFVLPVQANGTKHVHLRKLDFENKKDHGTLMRVITDRKPLSSQLGVTHDEHILLFYFLNVFSEDIYYWEEKDAIIVYEEEEGTLHLYDVISSNQITLEQALEQILHEGIKEVVFHFTPDLKDENMKKQRDSSNYLFVKSSNVMLPKYFRFPQMSQT